MVRTQNELSRRTFLRRVSALLSTAGVTAAAHSSLMDRIARKAARKWGSDALAADGIGSVHFCVEILIRAGFQTNCLFPSEGHLTPFGSALRSRALNQYSSPDKIITVPIAGSPRPLYIAPYTRTPGTVEGAQKLAEFAQRIAMTESVKLTNGHTDDWRARSPNNLAMCPTALHAMHAPGSAVKAVEFNRFGNGMTINRTGEEANFFSKVANRSEFLGLYEDLPNYFTKEELKLAIGEIEDGLVVDGRVGAIGDLDRLFQASQIKGYDDAVALSLSARAQAQLSMKPRVAIEGIDAAGLSLDPAYDAQLIADFGGAAEISRSVDGNVPIGQTLAGIAKGFRAKALTTATITLNAGDWHSFDKPSTIDMASSQQGEWNIWLGNALYGFLKTLDRTPDPHDPTKKMSDSFFLSISSEFTRTAIRTDDTDDGVNTNNNDGGSQAFIFIGSNVRGGSYGNVTGQGGLVGFDPVTGLTGGMAPTESQVWKSAGDLIGIPRPILDGQISGGAPIPVLNRRNAV